MPAMRVVGAALLKEGETQAFPIEGDKHKRTGFVIRYQGELLAFLNECPHWSIDLDLGDGEFFDPEIQRVFCKNHGALFVLPSGECETGPCMGRELTKFASQIDGNDLMVEV